MFKKILFVLGLIFLPTLSGQGQTTLSPSVGSNSHPNARISKVEITPNNTNVTVDYVKTEKDAKQAWVSFSSGIYIKPKNGFVTYHIQKLGGKDELDKKYSTRDSIGTVYSFVMVFPKLDAGVELIDIIEPPDGFKWENVSINNPLTNSTASANVISSVTIQPTEPQPTIERKEYREAPQSYNRQGTSIDEIATRAKNLKANKYIDFGYDKFSDFATVSVRPYNLVGGGESFLAGMAAQMARQNGTYNTNIQTDLYILIGTGFTGTYLNQTPDRYMIGFTSTATSWQFVGEDKTLYLIVDGTRLALEPEGSKSDIGGNYTTGVRAYEQLAYVVSYDDLSRIADASSVELRLGGTQPRRLKKELQARIRVLLDLLKVDGSTP